MYPPDIKVELQDSLTEEVQIKPDIVEEECQINTGILEEDSKIKIEIEEEQECEKKSVIVQVASHIKTEIEEQQVCQTKTDIVQEDSQMKTEIEEEQECQIETDIVQDENQMKTEIKEDQECQKKTEIEIDPILQIKTYILEKESLLQEVNAAPQDPFEPTLLPGPLDSQTKLMVINVHKYFRKLKLIRKRATGLSMNVNLCVAEATGVSLNKVNKIRQWYREKGLEWSLKPGYSRNRSSKKKD